MPDISEQELINTITELSKLLSSKVGMAERVSKHRSRTDTTSAEKDKRSVKNTSSREINAEDDLKTTILNLSKQILE